MLNQSRHNQNILLKNKLLITLLILQIFMLASMLYFGNEILQMVEESKVVTIERELVYQKSDTSH